MLRGFVSITCMKVSKVMRYVKISALLGAAYGIQAMARPHTNMFADITIRRPTISKMIPMTTTAIILNTTPIWLTWLCKCVPSTFVRPN